MVTRRQRRLTVVVLVLDRWNGSVHEVPIDYLTARCPRRRVTIGLPRTEHGYCWHDIAPPRASVYGCCYALRRDESSRPQHC